MHTAEQLSRDLYQFHADGREVPREYVIPAWGLRDRFGIVITEPFGDIGASLLVQNFINMFYDARPERRERDPQYPEIYVFHVGGTFGNHSPFDFYPARKEVFLEADSPTLLERLNDYGITHLALPECDPGAVIEPNWWADRHAFLERTQWASLYSASGRVQDPSFFICGLDPVVEANTRAALDVEGRLAWLDEVTPEDVRPRLAGPTPLHEAERWVRVVRERSGEVSAADRSRILRGRESFVGTNGLPTESYRQIAPTDALRFMGG
ncbi:hypothetical protein [Brevibacterium samyangense]|uniref:Uncharacterized protein n=1 Tax=Brevibacterium samyangense TaxID=366888 RepID=A0ABP5EPE8_9MICO